MFVDVCLPVISAVILTILTAILSGPVDFLTFRLLNILLTCATIADYNVNWSLLGKHFLQS